MLFGMSYLWASPSIPLPLAQALENRILWVPHGDCLEELGSGVGGVGVELRTFFVMAKKKKVCPHLLCLHVVLVWLETFAVTML